MISSASESSPQPDLTLAEFLTQGAACKDDPVALAALFDRVRKVCPEDWNELRADSGNFFICIT